LDALKIWVKAPIANSFEEMVEKFNYTRQWNFVPGDIVVWMLRDYCSLLDGVA